MALVRGVHHISLTTRRMEAMLEFYQGLLGLDRVSDVRITENARFDAAVSLECSRTHGIMLQAGNVHIGPGNR